MDVRTQHQSQSQGYQIDKDDRFDPNRNYRSNNLIYSSDTGLINGHSGQVVGSIADYDPINQQYGHIFHKDVASSISNNHTFTSQGPTLQNCINVSFKYSCNRKLIAVLA